MDTDANNHAVYKGGIYVLHPAFRRPESTKVDIVFLHGLLGGVFRTWRQRDDMKDEMYLQDDVAVSGKVSRLRSYQKQHIKSLTDAYNEEWDSVGRNFEFVYSDVPLEMKREREELFTYSGEEIDRIESMWEKKHYTMCWPKDWLPFDCRYSRVIGINYDSHVSLWSPVPPMESSK